MIIHIARLSQLDDISASTLHRSSKSLCGSMLTNLFQCLARTCTFQNDRTNRKTGHVDIFTCTLHRCSKSFLRSRAVQEYSLRRDLLSGYGKSDIQCSFVGLFTSVFHGCSKSFSVADKPVHKSFANAKQCTKQCPQECWHQL